MTTDRERDLRRLVIANNARQVEDLIDAEQYPTDNIWFKKGERGYIYGPLKKNNKRKLLFSN